MSRRNNIPRDANSTYRNHTPSRPELPALSTPARRTIATNLRTSRTIAFSGAQLGMTAAQDAELNAILILLRGDGVQHFHVARYPGADTRAAVLAKHHGYAVIEREPIPGPVQWLVDHYVFVAAPASEEEHGLSGTWDNVKQARRQHLCVIIVRPSGVTTCMKW